MKDRTKFYTLRESWATQAAVIFLSQSIVFRLIGSIGLWGDKVFASTQLLLPLASCALFIALLLLLGRRALWATSFPLLLGVVFFIVRSMGFESILHTVLCILLYLVVAILYIITVFGIIPTKLLLLPLFALPFVYHIFVEDLPALRNAESPVLFADGVMEVSVLCIMLGLFFTALAMKKQKPEPEAAAPADEPSAAAAAEPGPEPPADASPLAGIGLSAAAEEPKEDFFPLSLLETGSTSPTEEDPT